MKTQHHICDSDLSSLLERVAGGDEIAFKKIYLEYSPGLFRFIMPHVEQSKEDADGIVQDLFVKIWIKRESLGRIVSFKSYLYRMAKNELINQHLRKKKLREIMELKQLSETQTTDNVGLEGMIFNDYLKAAQQMINNLSPQRRRIYEMRTHDLMSIDEISKKLNISTSAVKKQLYEAINYLKKHVKDSFRLLLLLVILLF